MVACEGGHGTSVGTDTTDPDRCMLASLTGRKHRDARMRGGGREGARIQPTLQVGRVEEIWAYRGRVYCPVARGVGGKVLDL